MATHRKIFLVVILPLLFLGIGSFVVEDSGIYPTQVLPSSNLNWVPLEQIQLTDMKVHHIFFMDRISGKIQNNSQETLNSVVLRFILNGPNGKTEVNDVPFQGLAIAPGSSQGFEQTLVGMRKKPKEQWKWSFYVLTATGS